MPASCSAATQAAQLVQSAGCQAGVGRHQRHGVVAPVVREPQRRQVALVHPGGERHQLDGGDAQLREVPDGGRVGEARAGAADRRRDAGVGRRVAAHVQLVDRRVRPRHARAAPRRGRHRARHDRLRHEGRAVGVVSRRPVGHRAGLGRVQREAPVDRRGMGVDEELGGIEAVAVARVPGPVGAQAVARARPDAGHEAVEDVARAPGQRDARGLGVARGIEEAQLDGGRVGREDGDVGAPLERGDAERLGAAGADGGHGGSGRRVRPSRGCGRAPRTAAPGAASPPRPTSRAAAGGARSGGRATA